MTSTSSVIEQPGKPEKQTAGAAVHATIRRPKYGRKYVVADPEVSTGPIAIKGNSRVTFFIRTEDDGQFDLSLCYEPVFDINGYLDEGASKWFILGSSVITSPEVAAKQTFEDIGYAYRVVRATGNGDFTVYDWQMP